MSLRPLPGSNRDLLRAMQRTADAVRQPSRTFYDLIADSAATHADRIAILDAGGSISYAQLAQRCAQYARLFLSRSLGKGDCVALLMPNSGEYLAAWTGISAAGGIAALINTSLRGEALAHAVATVQPRVAIVHADLLETYLSACRASENQPALLVAGGRNNQAPAIEDALASASGAA
ncbi:MAG: AMP-binding protein, partial [Alphaproteobacteria bacterium]|nr:AMP-binding protein [Alphaproteobacteria bacterium]